jgi:signal transduction histidine kinase
VTGEPSAPRGSDTAKDRTDEPPSPAVEAPSGTGEHRYVLGLRPRMLAALLLTSVVTLAVAAVLLLSPLERQLRSEGESAVFGALESARPEFGEVGVDAATGHPNMTELAATVALLRRRSGAQVTVLDSQLDTIYSPSNQDLDVPDYYPEAQRALNTHKRAQTLDGEQLIAAAPVRIGPRRERFVVVVVRRLDYVLSAVRVVRRAFTEAAAVGLAIALLLGIGLTTTLLRRLERLREAARELERRGLEAPIPVDERRDEIGDLTRAFRSMQSRLREQEEARRAFVATASHELRTPLTSLDGTLELLEDDLDPESLDIEDARERTMRAREQSRRLSNLASDLLDISRLDAKVQLRTEPVELGEMCRAVAAEFERRATAREVSIEVHHPPAACWASGDPGAIARIVRILLDNAVAVAPAGSSIRAHTATQDGWAHVNVSDNGPGIAAEERERVFERFQRGSSSSGHSGFGLGLAIGRELASRMGGTLELLNTTPRDDHTGARFQLRLPAQPGEDDRS